MRTKQGTVVSAKADKTISVEVVTYESHPKYHKKFQKRKKFMAHDPENTYKEGDTVTIYETRPVSKNKTWSVVAPQTNQETK